MDATYTMLGGDGKEYGPATLEQMLSWIRDGRVSAATQVRRSDQNAWVSARDLPELQLPAAGAVPPVAPMGGVLTADRQHLVARLKSGGSWFYWIAALSLVNSIAAFTGSGWGFIVGLGITQLVDQVTGGVTALVVDILIAGLFVMFGVFANKGYLWAFIVGMALYALDGAIFAYVRDWLAAGFHAFVLFCLFSGFRAARQLRGVA